MFTSIFTDINATPTQIAIAFGVSVLCGIITSAVYRAGGRNCSRNMLISLIVLPIAVQSVIMLVNGSVGAGIAIAGAFSLVRYRSVPGTARDICALFIAMVSGVAAGTGYVAYALVFVVTAGVIMLIAEKVIPEGKGKSARKLKLTIPEDMEFNGAFDDIFEKFTTRNELVSVKTTNMGTMYELTYSIDIKDISQEKAIMDELRCRNGNLPVSMSHENDSPEYL